MDAKMLYLELGKKLIEQQKTVAKICTNIYGEDTDITKDALARVGKYTIAIEEYEREITNV